MRGERRGARGVGRRFVAVGLCLLALLAGGATADVAPVVVTARVEPEQVGIGTPFRYVVRVEVSGEAEIVTPLMVDRIGEFLIRDYGQLAAAPMADGGSASEQWYELVGYDAGHHLLRSGSIVFRQPGGDLEQVEVPETVVTITAAIADDADVAALTPRDIVAPVGVPRDRSLLWATMAAAAVLLAALALLFSWLWRRQGSAVVAAPPPHAVALAALTDLRRARLLEGGHQAEFYVRLSAIVRDYIEGRFHVRAPEMTTEEFLKAAQANRELPAEYRARLSSFLAEADLVKFARFVPTVEQGERAWDAAREFVSRTGAGAEEQDAAA